MKHHRCSRPSLAVAVMLTGLATFFFSQTAFACSDFQGNWDDQDSLTISNPSNGPSISGTWSRYWNQTGCWQLHFDPNVSGIDPSGNLYIKTTDACDPATGGYAPAGSYLIMTANQNSWSSNCDEVLIHWQAYDAMGTPSFFGDILSKTYADAETSNSSQVSPSWDEGTAYAWMATALTTQANGRTFTGRYFFEADNTPSPQDNCWFQGLSTSFRYDSLNKGFGGPNPNINNWGTLDSNSSWDDYVGWSQSSAHWYRFNNSTLLSGGACDATVGQLVGMVAEWPGVGWLYRYYSDNAHVITINSTDVTNNWTTYWLGLNNTTDDWKIESQRQNQVRKNFWPRFDNVTNFSAAPGANSIELSFTHSANAPDATHLEVFRDGIAGGGAAYVICVAKWAPSPLVDQATAHSDCDGNPVNAPFISTTTYNYNLSYSMCLNVAGTSCLRGPNGGTSGATAP